MLVPVVMLIMYFIKRYKIPERQIKGVIEKSEMNPTTDENRLEQSSRTRKLLIALVALSLTFYSGLEITYLNYSPTYYQYLPIHLSAQTSATVMSVVCTTYAVGRGVSAIISSRVRAEIMLSYHIVILIIALAVLHFGQRTEWMIYAGNAIIGKQFLSRLILKNVSFI